MQTLDKHFRELTAKVFARHGTATAELIIRWPEIAGAEMAALAEPVKIAWPRAGKDETRKSGGTLHLRAAAGRALEVRHLTPHLAQRINAYFGYGMVADMKFVAGSLPPKTLAPARENNPGDAAAVASRLGGIGDEQLHAALQRLGLGVWRRAAPQQGNAWNPPKTSIREMP